MPVIIGQQKLLSAINSYTMQTLPKSLMLIGPSGCGKHTVAKYVAEKFQLDFIEIDDAVTAADLDEFTHRTLNTLYLIDLNKFSEKQQNQFLKFVEEPSKSVYVVLVTNSEVSVINTLMNRCVKYTFEPYTIKQVEAIKNTTINSKAFDIFKTPGKLLNLTDDSFCTTMDLANSIVSNIASVPYPVVLATATKINYKDLYNKVDFNLFFDTIEYIAFEDFKNNNIKTSFTIFKITTEFKQLAAKQTLIKEMLMINYLTNLWEAVR